MSGGGLEAVIGGRHRVDSHATMRRQMTATSYPAGENRRARVAWKQFGLRTLVDGRATASCGAAEGALRAMNSFELNKILGAVLGTCLCLVAVHLFADTIFTPAIPKKPGYEIVVKAETPAQAGPKTPEQPFAVLLASANVDRGKSTTRLCQVCHTLDKGGPTKVGPNLWGVVGRPRASEPGYDYSAAMKAKGGTWTFDELDKFLAGPQKYIPGTKMTFTGVDNDKQRADLIAYLRTLSDNPLPLPKPPQVSAANKANQPIQPNQESAAPKTAPPSSK